MNENENQTNNTGELSWDQYIEQIHREALQMITHFLDTYQWEDWDWDIPNYCSYAGRLASMGVTEYIQKAEQILSSPEWSEKVNDMFYEAIQSGMWDLDQQTGSYLGAAIGSAQDYQCFFNHTSFKFDKRVLLTMENWADNAENTDLDSDAVETIENYLQKFPISDEDQLGIVAAPMSTVDLELIDPVLRPNAGQSYTAVWDAVNNRWEINTANNSTANNSMLNNSSIYVETVSETDCTTVFRIFDQNNRDTELPFAFQGFVPVIPVTSENGAIQYIADYQKYGHGRTAAELRHTDLTLVLPGGASATVRLGALQLRASWQAAAVSSELISPYLTNKTVSIAADSDTGLDNACFKIDDMPYELSFTYSSGEKLLIVTVFDQDGDYSCVLDGWRIIGPDCEDIAVFEDDTAQATAEDWSNKNQWTLIDTKMNAHYVHKIS